MKQIKKRFLSAFLSLVLWVCFCAVSVTAPMSSAAEFSASDYSALQTALSNGESVVLENDITVPAGETLLLASGSVLDGNGYALLPDEAQSTPLLSFAGEATVKKLTLGRDGTPLICSAVADDSAAVSVTWANVKLFTDIYSANACIGAWMNTASGTHVMTNCAVYGNVSAGSAAGFIHTVNGSVTMTDCTNHAKLMLSLAASANSGGLIGCVNGELKLTGCTNVGSLQTSYTDSGSSVYLGGLVGRTAVAIGLENCINYAAVGGGTHCAGLVGIGHVESTLTACHNLGNISATQYAAGFVANTGAKSFTNCLQAGNITSSKYAAGFCGRITANVSFSGCATIGDLTGNDSVAYLLANASNSPTVTAGNCFAAGKLDGNRSGAVLTKDLCQPSGVELITADGATVCVARLTSAGLDGSDPSYPLLSTEDAVTDLNTRNYGFTLMVDGSGIVVGTPILRGYQISTDNTNVRFLATIDSLQYQNVGFDYQVSYNGTLRIEDSVRATTVYRQINANEAGTLNVITAEKLCGTYIFAVSFINIPMQGIVCITVTPTTGDLSGMGYTVTFTDGVFTECVAA